MIAALICGVVGLVLVVHLDGWALVFPQTLGFLGLWLLLGGGERLAAWINRRPAAAVSATRTTENEEDRASTRYHRCATDDCPCGEFR